MPRSEIMAVLHFLNHTSGGAEVHIDCLSVLRTLQKMQQADWKPGLETPNGQLWDQVGKALDSRKGSEGLQFKKVKAHLSEEEAKAAGFSREALLVNKVADRLADEAADGAAYDKPSVERIEEADKKRSWFSTDCSRHTASSWKTTRPPKGRQGQGVQPRQRRPWRWQKPTNTTSRSVGRPSA